MDDNMTIWSYETYAPVSATEIFGKDAKKLLDACMALRKTWPQPYKDCYHAPHPTVSELRETLIIPEGSDFHTEAMKALKKWYDDHPGERDLEEASKNAVDAHQNKQIRIIFGVAKRHGCLIKQDLPTYGDRFTVYRNGHQVARIYC